MEPDESRLGEQCHDLPTVDMDVDLSAFDLPALHLKAIEALSRTHLKACLVLGT